MDLLDCRPLIMDLSGLSRRMGWFHGGGLLLMPIRSTLWESWLEVLRLRKGCSVIVIWFPFMIFFLAGVLIFEAAPLDAFDDKDPTSMSKQTRRRMHKDKTVVEEGCKLRIGYPREYNIQEMDPQIRQSWVNTLKSLQQRGHTVQPVSLPTTRQALSAYYVLAPAEASSNLAKYDGVRYGYRAFGPDDSSGEALYVKTRGNGFGDEVKRRILLGTYTLSSNAIENYFIQAQKVRRLVQKDFNTVFSKINPLCSVNKNKDDADSGENNDYIDFIICPTAPTLPPLLDHLEANEKSLHEYTNDVFTVPASLAGLPALSVPMSAPTQRKDHFVERRRKYGMQVVGQYGDDHAVLGVGKILEGIRDEQLTSNFNYHSP